MGLSETKIVDPNDTVGSGDSREVSSGLSSSTSPNVMPETWTSSDTTNTSIELEPGTAERFKMVVKKDLDYLVGNLEKLPESTRKLFNMAKLYLTTNSRVDGNEKDFISLFHTLPGRAETCAPGDAPLGAIDTKLKCVKNLFVPLKRSDPLHHAQTYIHWKSAQDVRDFYTFCLPKRRIIYLQPVDEFPEFIKSFRLKTHHLSLDLFETLQGFVQIFFSGLDVLVRSPVSMADQGWSVRSRNHEVTNRKQLCVNDLYPLLQNILPQDGVCIAAIIWSDIYPDGYNFVLGEASVKHRSAVISFGRYEPSSFNEDSQADVTLVDGFLLWKLFKSLSHELCHLFGLEHCTFFHCAMNESSSASDALSHPLFLCPICLRKLHHACGFNVLERYQQLREFLASIINQLENTAKFEESVAWLDLCLEYLNS